MTKRADLPPEVLAEIADKLAGFLTVKPRIIGLTRSGKHPALPCPMCGEPCTAYGATDVRHEPGPTGWHTAFHCGKCGFAFRE